MYSIAVLECKCYPLNLYLFMSLNVCYDTWWHKCMHNENGIYNERPCLIDVTIPVCIRNRLQRVDLSLKLRWLRSLNHSEILSPRSSF